MPNNLHDLIAERVDVFMRTDFDNDVPAEDLREMQARFDAVKRYPVVVEPRGKFSPVVFVLGLLCWLAIALAADAWLFN